jgi:bifunctional UDP-N-acetylglucosamine pyrophosphorylase/glucosamine-1-phosphate N-acetyltransferase
MAARAEDLFRLLGKVGNDNAAGEYYLPDIVMLAAAEGRKSVVIEAQPWEMAGVNSRAELALVEAEWQRRRRLKAMADGATLVAPETIWFAHDTQIGRDCLIEPNVVFGPGVRIADGVTIRAFSHIEGATIATGAEIGPMRGCGQAPRSAKRQRSGIRRSEKGAARRGAKANHLSYIGDAEVGEGANIGAGTITCNYDGFFKYPTKIGAAPSSARTPLW